MKSSRTSRNLVSRMVVRTLVEVVPPIAITSFGRGMILVGHAFEHMGKTLQSSGTVVEAFGEAQMRRNGSWFDMDTRPVTPTPSTSIPT